MAAVREEAHVRGIRALPSAAARQSRFRLRCSKRLVQFQSQIFLHKATRECAEAVEVMISVKPVKGAPRPSSRWGNACYDAATHPRFEPRSSPASEGNACGAAP